MPVTIKHRRANTPWASTAALLCALATGLVAAAPAEARDGQQRNDRAADRHSSLASHPAERTRVRLDFNDRYFWQRQRLDLRALLRAERPDLDPRAWRLARVRAFALSPRGDGRLALRSHRGRLDRARVPLPTGAGQPFSPVVLDLPQRPGRDLNLTVSRDVVLDRVVLVLEPRHSARDRNRDRPLQRPLAWQDAGVLHSHPRKVRARQLTLDAGQAIRVTGQKRSLRVAQAWLHGRDGSRVRARALEGLLRPGQTLEWHGQHAAGTLVLTLAPTGHDKRGYLAVATG